MDPQRFEVLPEGHRGLVEEIFRLVGHRVVLLVVCPLSRVVARRRRRRFNDWTSRASPGRSGRAPLGDSFGNGPGRLRALVRRRAAPLHRSDRTESPAGGRGDGRQRERRPATVTTRFARTRGQERRAASSSCILIPACTRSTFGRMLARQHRDLGAGAVAQRRVFLHSRLTASSGHGTDILIIIRIKPGRRGPM